jgi:hypothetical protein
MNEKAGASINQEGNMILAHNSEVKKQSDAVNIAETSIVVHESSEIQVSGASTIVAAAW